MTGDSELSIVTDAMPAAAVRCSCDGKFLWVNPRYAAWVARPAASIVGRNVAEIQPHAQKALQSEAVEYERLEKLEGLGERWVNWRFTPTTEGWVAIGTDVHDRKLAEEALKAEHQRKDEFLAALAHELRNPLAPMRNAVAILARKGSQDPEVAWSQMVLDRQIDQLARLIGDLVDIERIARGKLGLRRERVTLEAVVDMALESSRPHVNTAGHRLSVLMPSEPAPLEADPARLAQAFATLLRNAAKHTPPQGTIGFSAAIEGGEVVVSIEDSGSGLEPGAAARLFEEGAGVGLTLVQGIVTLHRGRIDARSAGRGRGAEFVVRLPLAAGVARQATARTRASPVRVLVADDNRDAADSLQRVLAHYGHEVRVAYDGASALRIGAQFRPRVAVLDIAMPGSSGYDVARAFRGQLGRDVTLVALTGWGQEADRRRALESGFDHHLVKPVDPRALADLLADTASK
jgi:signal transduction histidine kinase/CheY-like chemotaxis protein